MKLDLADIKRKLDMGCDFGHETAMEALRQALAHREPVIKGREHLTSSGTFQSDKYAWCPAGFVPLKLTDPMARDLLRVYAQRRAAVDAEFTRDLLEAIGPRYVAQCSGCGHLTEDRRAVTCCKGYCQDASGKSCNSWPCPQCGKHHYWTCSFTVLAEPPVFKVTEALRTDDEAAP